MTKDRPDPDDITLLLQGLHVGDQEAKELLLQRLYVDLRHRAELAMRGQPEPHTLQPTALVSEAYIRLVGPRSEPWADRTHFLAVASRAMRQILIDHARRKRTDKRSGGMRIPFEHLVVAYEERAYDLVALDDALTRLAGFDAAMAQAVEFRFFGGLSVMETASALGIPKRTFERRWKATRSWLAAQL